VVFDGACHASGGGWCRSMGMPTLSMQARAPAEGLTGFDRVLLFWGVQLPLGMFMYVEAQLATPCVCGRHASRPCVCGRHASRPCGCGRHASRPCVPHTVVVPHRTPSRATECGLRMGAGLLKRGCACRVFCGANACEYAGSRRLVAYVRSDLCEQGTVGARASALYGHLRRILMWSCVVNVN
jgi:hypothetical protein